MLGMIPWGCLMFQLGYITIARIFGLEIEEVYLFLTMIVAIISSFFYIKGRLSSNETRITNLETFHQDCSRKLTIKENDTNTKFDHIEEKIDEVTKNLDHKHEELYKGQQEILQTIINVMNAKVT
jgi:hypothetical protein